ncbi:hypothetical protein FGRMN_1771 [Fusarium graminum]|nr:hypothetical protein FGRMN_1771 [Fusarium graminum]
MRPLFAVLRHVVFASLTATSHGLLGVSNDKSVLGINNEFSGVCYTYVSVYPVLADVPDYITITKPYRGSVTALYTVPPQGDEPGIIIVEQPGGSSAPENVVIPATDDRSYVIIIRPHQGPNPITAPTTQVVPPRSGQPGQIIIETPETQAADATTGVLQPLTLEPQQATDYVTVLQPLNGTLASLQLITLTPTGTDRGTVIINIPASSLDLAGTQSLTIEPAEDGDYVTIVEPAGTSFTGTAPVRLTVAPSNGRLGTVIIQTPVAGTLRPVRLEAVVFTTLDPLGGLAGQTITIQPTDATGYVTIIEPAEGSVLPTAPIVTTILPTGTKPGTVLIQTPPEGNGGRPGGAQATGGAGADYSFSRGQPAGSVSYTTVTRGVPLGFDGDGSGSGGDSAGGIPGGSGSGQDEDGSSGEGNPGNVQGRPDQGQGDGDGPRQTITIPPEGGNPGTVLILTPENPDDPQTENNDEDDFPTGNQPTGSDGDDEESAQATGGSDGGNQDGLDDDPNNTSPGTGFGSGNTSGRPGQGTSSGNGDSETNDNGGSQGSVQGIGSGSSDDDGDDDSEDSGSSGSNSGNNSGSGGSDFSDGQDPGNGSSEGNEGSSSGSQNEDDPDFMDSGGKHGGQNSQDGSNSGSGSSSGGTVSDGGENDDNDDEETAASRAGGNAESSSKSSRNGSRTSQRQTGNRFPVVTTSPTTYTVTSGDSVITITSDVVRTVTNDRSKSSRSRTSKKPSGEETWSVDVGGLQGMGGSKGPDLAGTTAKRPSNSRATNSPADTTASNDGDGSEKTSVSSAQSRSLRSGSSSGSPSPDFSTSLDDQIRTEGNSLSSSRRRSTSSVDQNTGSLEDETTIVDSGPVETNAPEPITQTYISTSKDASRRPSSTGQAQVPTTSQFTSSQRPAVSSTSTSSKPVIGRPEGFGTYTDDTDGEATSSSTRRSSGVSISASASNSESPSISSIKTSKVTSRDGETTTQILESRSSSRSTRAGASGIPTSTGSSRTSGSEGATSPGANTRPGGGSISQTSQATTRLTPTPEASVNIETLIGSQSVAESERVEQGDETSTSLVRSETSTGAALRTTSTDGSGGATTIRHSDSQSTDANKDVSSAQSTSGGSGITGQPAGGIGGLETDDVGDGDASATESAFDGGNNTERPTDDSTSDAGGRISSSGGDFETPAPSSTESQITQEDAVPNTRASGSDAPTSSSDDDGKEGGQTEAASSSDDNAQISETDADVETETSESAVRTGASGPGSESTSETDESEPTTIVSAGEPIVATTTEITQTTNAPDNEAATITVFKSGSGPERTTLYIPPQSSDDAWTVVIVTPVSETQSEAATARGDGDILVTASAIGGNTNVTLFRAGSSPARRTIYIPPKAADQPGTIIIETPVLTAPAATFTTTAALPTGENSARDSTTVYSGGSGSVTRTIVISATATDELDTVVIVTPTSGSSPSNVTIYTGVSATIATTRFVPGAASDDPGTLIVETPIDASATESPVYVTVFSGGPGTFVTTIYLTPSAPGDSTTMVIQTPTQRSEAVETEDDESITNSVTGSQSTAITSVGNITIYTQAPGTVAGTFYFAPDNPEESGTVVIQTLTGDAEETGKSSQGSTPTTRVSSRVNTTIYSGGPVTAVRTLYISATISGEPDTVLIETPIASPLEETSSTGSVRTNTTIFVGGSFTATRTVFISATVSGEPDTVLVETPGTAEETDSGTGSPTGVFNVTISQGGPGSVLTTVYVAGQSGQPGTVIIQTPTESLDNGDPAETSASLTNITLTQGGPGSVATTIYIPGISGQPGTIIVEIPTGSTDSQDASGPSVSQDEVTITRGGPASAATTITIPGISGQPDTVLIETPTVLVDDQTSTTDDSQDDLTITRGGPVSVATTITIPGISGQPDTVLVETPTGIVEDQTTTTDDSQDDLTITRGGPVSAATTITILGVSGAPDTVLIQTPTGSGDGQETSETDSSRGDVTITRGGPVSVATTVTIPGISGQADTVLIETPTGFTGNEASATDGTQDYITITTGGSVSAAVTITIPGQPGQPDTVLIETPTGAFETPGNALANVTVYSDVPGSVTQTLYIPPTASGEAGTVVIQIPTGGASDDDKDTSQITAPITGITVSPQGRPNTTVYSGGPVSAATTVYISATVSGEPDTIFIQTPTAIDTETDAVSSIATGTLSTSESIPNVTITSGGSASTTRTVYYPPASDDPEGPGTVVIETPTSEAEAPANVTRFVGGPASFATTIYIAPTVSGEAGTVIIQTPTSEPDETASTTDAPAGGQNTTIYSGGPGSVATTIYYPPASDDPNKIGTIVVQTPTSRPSQDGNSQTSSSTASETSVPVQNITSYVGGPYSVKTTIYIPPTASGEPGTVLIATPMSSPDQTTSASITESITGFEPPIGLQNVTRFVGGPASVTTTIYIPPTAVDEPGTVLIQTPTSGPDNNDSSLASVTNPFTSAESPTGVQNVTSFIGGPASVTTTIYIPPAVSGDPGTVLIQTPTTASSEEVSTVPTSEGVTSTEEPSVAQNVTRFIGGPASITTTVYIPPAVFGDPGTVLIQTPSIAPSQEASLVLTTASITSAEGPSVVQNVTRFVGGPASITTTIYFPPAVSGDPGTVIIQTPTADPSSEIITSSVSSSIIQNITSYIGGPASATTTIYIPPTGPNEPGTVLIQTPTSTLGEALTSEALSTTSLPTTVQNVTLVIGGPASVITTIYIPPATSGGPGTVLIQTPTSEPGTTSSAAMTSPPAVVQNVTIYGDGTGSTTRTIYRPPVSEGGPGTVLIETPAAAPDTSTTSSVAVGVSSTTTTSSTVPAASTSTSAAASSPSSSIAAAAPTTTSTSSAVVIPPTTSSSSVTPTTSSSSAIVTSSSSSAAIATASSSSSAAVILPPTTTSAAAVVVTTSTSTIPVVPTTSTSMMPQASFGPTFDCDGYGYVLSSLLSNTLTRVNLVTGERVAIKSRVGPGGAINGVGFNPIDNYIYGFVTQPLLKNLLCGLLGCPQSQLIRIAKDGQYEMLPLILTTNTISMGDVDSQGILWVSESGNKWWSVDLRRGANFGKLINSGTSDIGLLNGVGDWAYVPGGGNYLYSVQASVIESGLLRTNIVRWPLATQKWERYQSYPNLLLTALNLIWGAVVAAPGGVLFAQENLLGQTWRFTLGSTESPTALQGGAILNLSGDGAKCASGAL